MYLNENTGVEFSLEWIDLSNEEEKADYLGITGKILLLSIPLVKSHIVAFEVTMELEELINEFELQVADLQEYEDNPKFSKFDTVSFLKSWYLSNLVCCARAISSEEGTQIPIGFMEKEEIDICWNWNLNNEAMKQHLQEEGRNLSVPLIQFLTHDRKVETFVEWNQTPAALPIVDIIFVEPWNQGKRVKDIAKLRNRSKEESINGQEYLIVENLEVELETVKTDHFLNLKLSSMLSKEVLSKTKKVQSKESEEEAMSNRLLQRNLEKEDRHKKRKERKAAKRDKMVQKRQQKFAKKESQVVRLL